MGRLDSHKKLQIILFLDIAFNYTKETVTLHQFIQKMFEAYVSEHFGKLNCSTDCLTRISDSGDSISVPAAIKKIFLHKDIGKKSSVTKLMFFLFKNLYGLDDESDACKIHDYIVENNIVRIFKYKKVVDSKFMNLNFNSMLKNRASGLMV